MKKIVLFNFVMCSLITAFPALAQVSGKPAWTGKTRLRTRLQQRISASRLRALREQAMKDFSRRTAAKSSQKGAELTALQDLLDLVKNHPLRLDLAKQAAQSGKKDLVRFFVDQHLAPGEILPNALAYPEIVNLLLDHHAAITDPKIFEQAARHGYRETVNLLCARANPTEEIKFEMFSQAVKNKHFEIAQDLVDKFGVDVNHRQRIAFAGTAGRPLLDECLSHNQEEQVRFLLQNGADPYVVVFGNQTLVHVTAHFYDPAYLAIFKEYGIDVNVRTQGSGDTPLHAEIRSLERTKALLEAGADPTLVNNAGQTPLQEAQAQLAKEKADPKHANYSLISDLQNVINYYEHLLTDLQK